MSTVSSIEWCDATWNPVRGCSKVSAGCTNCYAMKQAHRFSGPGKAYEGLTHLVRGKGPQWTGAIKLVPEVLTDPLRWRAPRRVFVNSMSDLFHDSVATGFIDRVFAIMAMTPQHTYQILTKRPERMERYVRSNDRPLRHHPVQGWIDHFIDTSGIATREDAGLWGWPLPNVWLGVSVEDQAAADERIPHLLRTPAAVRFLSCEPLLGPVDLRPFLFRGAHLMCPRCLYATNRAEFACPNDGVRLVPDFGVDWVIAGGESGPGARPCNVQWIRSLVEQCRVVEVPVFVKQLGARPTKFTAFDSARGRETILDDPLHLRDRKGADPSEWPSDLNVREFPQLQEART